jgi:hypothetical protein
MCGPRFSHLIQEETNSINDGKFQNMVSHNTDDEILNTSSFNLLDLDTMVRLYIAGGEPTVMPEVYEFLRNCVEQKKTNFELKPLIKQVCENLIKTKGNANADQLLDIEYRTSNSGGEGFKDLFKSFKIG